MKAWNQKKKRFSLVSVGMVNHSFLIFFAPLTMFIVKLDRQSEKSIALTSAFGSKIDVAYQTDLLWFEIKLFFIPEYIHLTLLSSKISTFGLEKCNNKPW